MANQAIECRARLKVAATTVKIMKGITTDPATEYAEIDKPNGMETPDITCIIQSMYWPVGPDVLLKRATAPSEKSSRKYRKYAIAPKKAISALPIESPTAPKIANPPDSQLTAPALKPKFRKIQVG